MKNPIGFERTPDSIEKQTELIVGEIEEEFKTLISELKIDESITAQHLAIDKRIREEVVKIYKMIKSLEEKTKERMALVAQVSGYINDFPKKCMEIIDRIDKLNDDLVKDSKKIYDEISKHMVQNLSEVYKEIELSEEQTKHLRAVVKTLSSTLDVLMAPVNQSLSTYETNRMREYLMKISDENK